MGAQLPKISPVITEKPTYSQALVAYPLYHEGQLYMVAYQYNFTDAKTIEQQEAIIRDHLSQPADSNGDRPVDTQNLNSVSRIYYSNGSGSNRLGFSNTFTPTAITIYNNLQTNNSTAFIVNKPHNGFSDKTVLNRNSSYSYVLSAVNQAGNSALEAHRRQQELAR